MAWTFKCRRCGDCCHVFTLAAVTPEEADLLGVGNVCQDPDGPELKLRKVKRRGRPAWAMDGVCVFYRDGCTVYDRRPALCRDFTCEDHALPTMVFAVAQGLYCSKIKGERRHAAIVDFMRGRWEIKDDG